MGHNRITTITVQIVEITFGNSNYHAFRLFQLDEYRPVARARKLSKGEIDESATSSDTEKETGIKETNDATNNDVTTNEVTTNDNSDETTVKTVTVKQAIADEPAHNSHVETSYQNLDGTYEVEADESISSEKGEVSENSDSEGAVSSLNESESDSDEIQQAEPSEEDFVIRLDSTSDQLSVIKEEPSIIESEEEATSHHLSTVSISEDQNLTFQGNLNEYLIGDTSIIHVMKGWNVESGAEPEDDIFDDDLMDFIPWVEVKEEMERLDEKEPPENRDAMRMRVVEDWIEPEHMFNIDCGISSNSGSEQFESFLYPILAEEDLMLEKAAASKAPVIEFERSTPTDDAEIGKEDSVISESDATSMQEDQPLEVEDISQKSGKISLSEESVSTLDESSSAENETTSELDSEQKDEKVDQTREEARSSTGESSTSANTTSFESEKIDVAAPATPEQLGEVELEKLVSAPASEDNFEQVEREDEDVTRKEFVQLEEKDESSSEEEKEEPLYESSVKEKSLEKSAGDTLVSGVSEKLQKSNISESSKTDLDSSADDNEEKSANVDQIEKEVFETQNTTEELEQSSTHLQQSVPKAEKVERGSELGDSSSISAQSSNAETSQSSKKVELTNNSTTAYETTTESSHVLEPNTTAELSKSKQDSDSSLESGYKNEVLPEILTVEPEKVPLECEIQHPESEKPTTLEASSFGNDTPSAGPHDMAIVSNVSAETKTDKNNESSVSEESTVKSESTDSESDKRELVQSIPDVDPLHETTSSKPDEVAVEIEASKDETTHSHMKETEDCPEQASKKSSSSSSDPEDLSHEAKEEYGHKKTDEDEITVDELNPIAKLESGNNVQQIRRLESVPQTDDVLEIQSGSNTMIHGKRKDSELNKSASDFYPELEAFISSPIDKKVFVLEAPKTTEIDENQEVLSQLIETDTKEFQPEVVQKLVENQLEETMKEFTDKDRTSEKPEEPGAVKSTAMEESELFETASDSEDLSTVSNNSQLVSFHDEDFPAEKIESLPQLEETKVSNLKDSPVEQELESYLKEIPELNSSKQSEKEPSKDYSNVSAVSEDESAESKRAALEESETSSETPKAAQDVISSTPSEEKNVEVHVETTTNLSSDKDVCLDQMEQEPKVQVANIAHDTETTTEADSSSSSENKSNDHEASLEPAATRHNEQEAESSEAVEASRIVDSDEEKPELKLEASKSIFVTDSSFDQEQNPPMVAPQLPNDEITGTREYYRSYCSEQSKQEDSTPDEEISVENINKTKATETSETLDLSSDDEPQNVKTKGYYSKDEQSESSDSSDTESQKLETGSDKNESSDENDREPESVTVLVHGVIENVDEFSAKVPVENDTEVVKSVHEESESVKNFESEPELHEYEIIQEPGSTKLADVSVPESTEDLSETQDEKISFDQDQSFKQNEQSSVHPIEESSVSDSEASEKVDSTTSSKADEERNVLSLEQELIKAGFTSQTSVIEDSPEDNLENVDEKALNDKTQPDLQITADNIVEAEEVANQLESKVDQHVVQLAESEGENRDPLDVSYEKHATQRSSHGASSDSEEKSESESEAELGEKEPGEAVGSSNKSDSEKDFEIETSHQVAVPIMTMDSHQKEEEVLEISEKACFEPQEGTLPLEQSVEDDSESENSSADDKYKPEDEIEFSIEAEEKAQKNDSESDEEEPQEALKIVAESSESEESLSPDSEVEEEKSDPNERKELQESELPVVDVSLKKDESLNKRKDDSSFADVSNSDVEQFPESTITIEITTDKETGGLEVSFENYETSEEMDESRESALSEKEITEVQEVEKEGDDEIVADGDKSEKESNRNKLESENEDSGEGEAQIEEMGQKTSMNAEKDSFTEIVSELGKQVKIEGVNQVKEEPQNRFEEDVRGTEDASEEKPFSIDQILEVEKSFEEISEQKDEKVDHMHEKLDSTQEELSSARYEVNESAKTEKIDLDASRTSENLKEEQTNYVPVESHEQVGNETENFIEKCIQTPVEEEPDKEEKEETIVEKKLLPEHQEVTGEESSVTSSSCGENVRSSKEDKLNESSSSESTAFDDNFFEVPLKTNIPDFDVDLLLAEPAKSQVRKLEKSPQVAKDLQKNDDSIIPDYSMDVFAEGAPEDDWVKVELVLGSPIPLTNNDVKGFERGQKDTFNDDISAIEFESQEDGSFPFSYDKMAELADPMPKISLQENQEPPKMEELETSVKKNGDKTVSEFDPYDLENLTTYTDDSSQVASSRNVSGGNLLEEEIRNADVDDATGLQAALESTYLTPKNDTNKNETSESSKIVSSQKSDNIDEEDTEKEEEENEKEEEEEEVVEEEKEEEDDDEETEVAALHKEEKEEISPNERPNLEKKVTCEPSSSSTSSARTSSKDKNLDESSTSDSSAADENFLETPLTPNIPDFDVDLFLSNPANSKVKKFQEVQVNVAPKEKDDLIVPEFSRDVFSENVTEDDWVKLQKDFGSPKLSATNVSSSRNVQKTSADDILAIQFGAEDDGSFPFNYDKLAELDDLTPRNIVQEKETSSNSEGFETSVSKKEDKLASEIDLGNVTTYTKDLSEIASSKDVSQGNLLEDEIQRVEDSNTLKAALELHCIKNEVEPEKIKLSIDSPSKSSTLPSEKTSQISFGRSEANPKTESPVEIWSPSLRIFDVSPVNDDIHPLGESVSEASDDESKSSESAKDLETAAQRLMSLEQLNTAQLDLKQAETAEIFVSTESFQAETIPVSHSVSSVTTKQDFQSVLESLESNFTLEDVVIEKPFFEIPKNFELEPTASADVEIKDPKPEILVKETESAGSTNEPSVIEDIFSTNNDWNSQPLESAPDLHPTSCQDKPALPVFDWRSFELPDPSVDPNFDFTFKSPDKEEVPELAETEASPEKPEKTNSVLDLVDQLEKEIMVKTDYSPPPAVGDSKPVIKKKPTFLPEKSEIHEDVSIPEGEGTRNYPTPEFNPQSLPDLPDVYEIADKVMNKSRTNEIEQRPQRQSHLFTVRSFFCRSKSSVIIVLILYYFYLYLLYGKKTIQSKRAFLLLLENCMRL